MVLTLAVMMLYEPKYPGAVNDEHTQLIMTMDATPIPRYLSLSSYTNSLIVKMRNNIESLEKPLIENQFGSTYNSICYVYLLNKLLLYYFYLLPA